MEKSGGKWNFAFRGEKGLFRGISKLCLDTKGRIAVPTKYRDSLKQCCDAQLVVTIDRDRCLLVYPLPEWQDIEFKLKSLPSFNKAARSLQRLYIGHASEVEMDAQGRLLLPPELREFAGLERDVVLVGQGNKFELWDEQAWNRQREAWLGGENFDDSELPPELSSLSL